MKALKKYLLTDRSGNLVGKYSTLNGARGARDRKDLAYGAIVGLILTDIDGNKYF